MSQAIMNIGLRNLNMTSLWMGLQVPGWLSWMIRLWRYPGVMQSSGWLGWTIKVLRMGHWRRCLVMKVLGMIKLNRRKRPLIMKTLGKKSSQSFLHMSHNTLPGMPAPVLISCFPDMPTVDSSDCRLSAG